MRRCVRSVSVVMRTSDCGTVSGRGFGKSTRSLARCAGDAQGCDGHVLAFGHKTTGHIDEGLEVIGATRRWLQQSEGYYPLAWPSYVEALLLLKRGTYLEARRARESGLELVDNKLNGHPAHASLKNRAGALIRARSLGVL